MRYGLVAALLFLLPSTVWAGDLYYGKTLYRKGHGAFTVTCYHANPSNFLNGWKKVRTLCGIRIYPEADGFDDLGEVRIGAKSVTFDVYRHKYPETYIGYTIEQNYEVIWTLPDVGLADHSRGNPLSGAERRAFMEAMAEGEAAGGTLRLRFTVAYSNERSVDLRIPLVGWRDALVDMRREAVEQGLPAEDW